jgi:Ca2+-binding RTX toxin-like protein
MWRCAVSLAAALAALLTPMAPEPSAALGAPSCAEGPRIVGNTYYGTPCDDTIRMPRTVTRAHGEAGDDTIYGQRGNDFLFGGEGNDRLYGGIGDDQLRGGPGDDLLSGGFGADSALDGEAGNDLVRGDATIDRIENSGGGVDTLSYATGVTPGFFDRPNPPYSFPAFSDYARFPSMPDGRGAYIDLETGRGDNGRAPDGGGFDEEVDGAGFEVVIGTPYADYLVGTAGDQTLYGGGGADVILGGGGNDTAYGGAEGDYCDAPTSDECEFGGGAREVEPRDPSTVAAGEMASPAGEPAALYLTGSDNDDELVAAYSGSTVSFSDGGSPVGSFPLGEPPDSVVLAGLGGDDTLTATGFPASTSIVALGGDGADEIVGGATEDALVDGPGDDAVSAAGGDDAVPNNEGADELRADSGEDLFVSDAVCEGDLLDGGPDRDNANWANFDHAVSIDMGIGLAGLVGTAGQPACGGAPPTTLANLEDVEGTNLGDVMVGDSSTNQLLGRPGQDAYFAAAGDDSILANSGDTDLAIDCGPGWDTALIDIPSASYSDPTPVDCEDVEARAKNSFRPPGTPPDPGPEASFAGASQATRRIGDRRAPRTRILHRPRGRVFARSRLRRVVFAFRADEARASFRCKLDRRRYRPCRSPRAYRLWPGRHAFGVFAIDAAGNRDRSPAVFRFSVRRLSAHSSRSRRRRAPTR